MSGAGHDKGRVTAYIGVGANLGFSRDAVMNALVDLEGLPDTEFIAASSLYSSAPVEAEGPDFINAVAELHTGLTAAALLAALNAIEHIHGRVRTLKNAPRTLDLDLLLFGAARINTPDLTVPHPRMAERAFVLLPLLELAPDIDIPGHGKAADLVAKLGTAQRIERL